MQNAPDIELRLKLHVKHEIRVFPQRPNAQAIKSEFIGVAGRANRGLLRDVPKGALQRVDEAECGGFSSLSQVVGDGLVDITLGAFARDDRLGRHACLDWRARWRSVSK
jgi:hypothetical protein